MMGEIWTPDDPGPEPARIDLAIGALQVAIKTDQLDVATCFAKTALDFLLGDYDPENFDLTDEEHRVRRAVAPNGGIFDVTADWDAEAYGLMAPDDARQREIIAALSSALSVALVRAITPNWLRMSQDESRIRWNLKVRVTNARDEVTA